MLAAPLLLCGCESLRNPDSTLGWSLPYRIEIVQGNVVTKEQLALLKPGMSRAQVRDVLGTPLLTDPFHADRWDYLFTIRRPGTPSLARNVIVRFENDRVATVDAPELPSEADFVASISRARPKGELRPLELTEEERKALPPPAPQSGPAGPSFEPQGPVRDYPPLEAS